jgi:hypothetical protein
LHFRAIADRSDPRRGADRFRRLAYASEKIAMLDENVGFVGDLPRSSVDAHLSDVHSDQWLKGADITLSRSALKTYEMLCGIIGKAGSAEAAAAAPFVVDLAVTARFNAAGESRTNGLLIQP